MLSIDEAYSQVSKFYNAHKGLEGTSFEIYEIQEDAFPQASFRWHKDNTPTGAFLPDSNTVVIIANNNRSMEELNKTLRHEVFGHYALNVISNQDKVALLETISNAPDDSEIGKHRDTLASTFYSNLKDKPLLLAEEVYAHTAERSFEEIEHFISVPDPRSVESEKDLLSFISSVKNGIHHGVLNYNSYEHVEGFIVASLDAEMQTEEGLQGDTRKRILDYASLMDDAELEVEVNNGNMESLETLKEYFTQLDKGEYVTYSDFVEENLLLSEQS